MRKKGFTLVEVLIVVAILGIMAAIVLPSFQGNVAQAKESASKNNLAILRAHIELYKLQHNGYPPGYVNGSGTSVGVLELQFTRTTTVAGLAHSTSTIPTDPFLYGPYVRRIPPNAYNNLSNIIFVAEGTEFSAAADGASSGWLYKKETAEIRLNWTGTDGNGVAYCDY